MAFLAFSPDFSRCSACRALLVPVVTDEHEQLLQPRPAAGQHPVGGTVAYMSALPLPKVHQSPRNSADACGGISVERCEQLRTILRAVLLFDEARATVMKRESHVSTQGLFFCMFLFRTARSTVSR